MSNSKIYAGFTQRSVRKHIPNIENLPILLFNSIEFSLKLLGLPYLGIPQTSLSLLPLELSLSLGNNGKHLPEAPC